MIEISQQAKLSAQEGGEERESQSTSGEKVEGDGKCTQPMPAKQILPMNPIPPAEPAPTATTSTATTQMPVVKSAATSIPVTVYNLVQGKFEGIPYPMGRPLSGRKSFWPQLQDIPQQRQQPEAAPAVTTLQIWRGHSMA